MARHRDIRNMDYTDDYDGYDDIYGHSLDDDYYISPSNRQFVYNRETSRDGRFEPEDDIQEVDEVDELSDTDKAKLQSCIDQIKDTLGAKVVPRNELVNLILKYKFNVELVLNAILEDPTYEKNSTGAKEKDVAQFSSKKFTIPQLNMTNIGVLESKPKSSIYTSKINNKEQESPLLFNVPSPFSKNITSQGLSPKSFTIPDIFGSKPEADSAPSNSSPRVFAIPNIFGTKIEIPSPSTISSVISKPESDKSVLGEFNSLSELVSSHLKNSLPTDITLQGTTNKISMISTKLSTVSLSDNNDDLKFSSNLSNDLSIDLSKALRNISSVSSVAKHKENVPEKFDIPFIDCDTEVNTDKLVLHKTKILPCTLDVRCILNQKIWNHKKPSQLGKIVCRRYRSLKTKIIVPERQAIPARVIVFAFNTQSPDDFINSHLKKQ